MSTIKELKEGYLSQVIHKITELLNKYKEETYDIQLASTKVRGVI